MLPQVFHSTPISSLHWANPIFQGFPQFAAGITKTSHIKRGEKLTLRIFTAFPCFNKIVITRNRTRGAQQ